MPAPPGALGGAVEQVQAGDLGPALGLDPGDQAGGV
jgi:hypothetical protein